MLLSLEKPMWLSAAKAVYTLAPPARRLVFRHVAERRVSAHDDLAAEWGVPHRAEWATVAQQHDVRTTYILGSGSSINEYSDAMFERIGSGWSVALNSWSEHHSFVPDVLLIENMSKRDGLARLEPKSWPSSVFVTRFPSIGRFANKRHGVDSGDLRGIMKHYVALPMLGLTPTSYAQYVDDLLSLSDGFPHVVGPNRTSIERAVVIAAIAGAKEVVLCGTDLQGPYFWESLRVGPVRRHGTDTGEAFRRSVARRLPVLAEVLSSRLDTTVTLGLERGPLTGVLPVHTWENGRSLQSKPR